MPDQEKNIKDILETVNFIKDNAASKDDLTEISDDLNVVKEDLTGVKNELNLVKVNMATKEDLNQFEKELKGEFNQLQTAVDNFAKKTDNYFQEVAALNSKVNRHEKWIQSLASKLEINLEY